MANPPPLELMVQLDAGGNVLYHTKCISEGTARACATACNPLLMSGKVYKLTENSGKIEVEIGFVRTVRYKIQE